MSSLRTRILLLATGTAALVIVLAGFPIALLLRSQVYAATERLAHDAAQGTADYLTTATYDDTVLRQYLHRLNARGTARVTVVAPDGDVLGAGLPRGLPESTTERPHLGNDQDHDNLGQISSAQTLPADGRDVVRMYAQTDRGTATVLAGTDDDRVAAEVRTRYALVAAAALALLLLAAAAAEVTSRRLVRPLRQTADTAVRLSRGDLLARAPVEGPVEVAEVAVELNALADRIDELLAGERETVADLSHRLRTPLTAVRLGVEALPPGERRVELEGQVAALERTLSQVIRAARRPQREGVHPRCDAAQIVAGRIEFWRPLAEDQGRDVVVSLPAGPLPVRAAAEDLAAAVDALVENVIAHTEEGGALEVRLGRAREGAALAVLDDGPGIAAAALDRGRSDRGSTGLGLDIARSTADASGGRLELVDGPGRRGVRLLLGVPAAGTSRAHRET